MKTITQALAAGVLVLGAAFVGIAPAHAVAGFDYTVTLSDSSGSPGPYTGTLQESFAPNISNGTGLIPDAFSFSIGAETWSGVNSGYLSDVTTDSTGALETFNLQSTNALLDQLNIFYDTGAFWNVVNDTGVPFAGDTVAIGLAVPEPAAIGLMIVGLLGLGLTRRRAA